MLIPNQIVKMKWNSRNKKYYQSLGYVFTKNRQEADKRRNYFVRSNGYKGTTHKLPTREQIIEAVDYLVKGNHSLKFIDLDIDI